MEFDTSIKLREIRTDIVKSDKDLDSFTKEVWNICKDKSRAVADTGGGEIWMDYSDFLRTRHLVVDSSPCEGGFSVKFRGGSKPSLVGDVLIMGLLLLMFWLLGKVFVPDPPVGAVVGICLSAVAVFSLLLYCGKHFGAKAAGEILKEMQK